MMELVPPSLPAFHKVPLPVFIDELAEGQAEGNPCGLGLDVDEAAHAGFALMKNDGVSHFGAQAQHQAELAAQHHLTSAVAFEPLASGTSSLLGMLCGSAFVAPAAGFAMHAGLHEWREAGALAEKFRAREAGLQQQAERTQQLSGVSRVQLGALTTAFDQAAEGRIQDNARQAATAARGGLIGKYSFLSGGAITARIAVELARNFGGAAASGSTHVASAASAGMIAPSFLAGTGLASNGFAALASAFAVMLGVHFVRKTAAVQAQWSAEAPELKRAHTRLGDQSGYGRFLAAKGRQRENFIRRFHLKNRFFLCGAGVYAAGTILPTCIKLMIAAGILSSKKISANLILGLFYTSIAGAVIMGLFSHQFFYGHPNIERYEQYGLKDTKELDRRFLANIDTFGFIGADGRPQGEAYAREQGLAMREAAFDCVRRIEVSRNALLADIAAGTNRTYELTAHTGDADYLEHRPLQVKLRRLLRRDALRQRDIENWASVAEHQPRLLQTAIEIVNAKIAYLERKHALHKRMYDQVVGGAKTAAQIHERRAYAETMFGSCDETEKLLTLRRGQRTACDAAKHGDAAADTLRAIFTPLEQDAPADEKPPEEIPFATMIAEQILTGIPARHNHERGILLEIEKEAGRRRASRPVAAYVR